uniref:Protein lifeguard 2 n=1 Tax=Echeneis naucrates TaxID=173247 RepID=A0A665X8W6_ECHNA
MLFLCRKCKSSYVFLQMINIVLTPTISQQVNDDNEPPSYQEATAGYDEMEAQFAWDDKTIRQTFIRKVYAILMVQLLVTVAVVCLFTFHFNLTLCHLMFLFTYIALSCCGDLRRQFPWNSILLVLFTLSMAFMMGFMSSFYNTKSVALCLGITALVCLSVTIFSFQSKVDVTSCQGILFSLCMVMLFCSLVTCHLCSDRSHPLYSGENQILH